MNKIKLKENKFFKIALNNNFDRGITLIALIITIIVMLILVGVTLTVSLNGGLFSTAKKAVKQTQISELIERAQTDILIEQARNGGNITKDKLKEILDKYFKDVPDPLPDDLTGLTLAAKDEYGGYTDIPLSDIYDGVLGETVLASTWTESEDGITNGKVTLQIGDYINYEEFLKTTTVNTEQLYSDLQEYSGYDGESYNTEYPQNKEDLKWRVLDVKNGNLRLISEVPTESTVYLKGYNGYNNAVYLIDEICSTLYSTNKGTAQNLKIEDIEDKINKEQFDYTQDKHSYVDTGKYGGTKEYTDNLYYPEIFAKEKTGWVDDNQGTEYDLSEQKDLIKQTEDKKAQSKMKITHTYWNRNMQESDWKNKIYNNIFTYGSYWLSSRCTSPDLDVAYFRVYRVENGNIKGRSLYNSDHHTIEHVYKIRPIVSLNPDIQIGDKVEDVWQIK